MSAQSDVLYQQIFDLPLLHNIDGLRKRGEIDMSLTPISKENEIQTITLPATAYDSTKIDASSIHIYQWGKMLYGNFTIKAGVITGGYQTLTFNIGKTFKGNCPCSFLFGGSSDYNKDINIALTGGVVVITSPSGTTNTALLNVYFMAMVA